MNYNEEILDVLLSEFEQVRKELVEAYIRKGMKSSGAFEEELKNEVETAPNYAGVTLWGAKHTEQLEYGRRAGKAPPMQVIYDWLIKKRIMDSTFKEYQIRGLAFVIARKIAREGWNRAEHGGVGLISEVINHDRIKKIIDSINPIILPIFEAEVLTMIKTLKV